MNVKIVGIDNILSYVRLHRFKNAKMFERYANIRDGKMLDINEENSTELAKKLEVFLNIFNHEDNTNTYKLFLYDLVDSNSTDKLSFLRDEGREPFIIYIQINQGI